MSHNNIGNTGAKFIATALSSRTLATIILGMLVRKISLTCYPQTIPLPRSTSTTTMFQLVLYHSFFNVLLFSDSSLGVLGIYVMHE